MMTIPKRDESRFHGQYGKVIDADRLVEIFKESGNLCVTSKNPETAHSRYELAIEAYHQLMSLPIDSLFQKDLVHAMETVAERFPSQVCMNEALGYCDKAKKVKTLKAQLKHLRKAQEILENGLARNYIGRENIKSTYEQVVENIERGEEMLKETDQDKKSDV